MIQREKDYYKEKTIESKLIKIKIKLLKEIKNVN